MELFNRFTQCTLLTTSSIFAISPQIDLSPATLPLVNYNSQLSIFEMFDLKTYDGIMQLLEEVESGELEKKCTPFQLQQVNVFLANLAKEGDLSKESGEERNLVEDSEDLVYGKDIPVQFAYSLGTISDYQAIPAILHRQSQYDVLDCGGIGYVWNKTKKFAKKHKTAIIIGAVVVTVAVVAVIATPAAGVALGTAAGEALSSLSSGSSELAESEFCQRNSSVQNFSEFDGFSYDEPFIQSAMGKQVSYFKDNVVKEGFFNLPSGNQQGISIEEVGRIVGSLFAHDSVNQFSSPFHPFLEGLSGSKDIPRYESKAFIYESPSVFTHSEIDKRFSTDYASLFSDPSKEMNVNALSYKALGEKAISFGSYDQAVHDFNKVISINPTDPVTCSPKRSSVAMLDWT